MMLSEISGRKLHSVMSRALYIETVTNYFKGVVILAYYPYGL